MRNGDDFSPAVIDRVAGLLDEFCDGSELTLSQLSCRTGLPRSSAHRLLSQLVEFGWVSRRGRVYSLSRAVFEWGALAQWHDNLYRAAHPVLHELHATTGLMVHLAVLDGNDVRYLDGVGCDPDILPSRIGGRQPALRTALGKAIIAHSGMGPVRTRSTVAPLPSARADARLRREIAHIRQQHIAHEREEAVSGVACVAAAIGNSRTCVGAISVAGPLGNVDIVTLAMPVRSAARVIWQDLSGNGSALQAG
ncbi:IclR family transcriptional regulator [Nocardia donostiensis]|uniref:IclR family transcriptional regulator n=1 Tax=Nocardia donostiensis TaxID=1538463 RepID=A0A1W0B607_9NOCA|nr:IclR family transcriptional regulator [Nocardia donostiensis]OQS15646.1 IclR family transcriptional regulator [Nocardia donostiensis]OQS17940.1 IclR family transcriptional regulator [Nocardia donostiensis]